MYFGKIKLGDDQIFLLKLDAENKKLEVMCSL